MCQLKVGGDCLFAYSYASICETRMGKVPRLLCQSFAGDLQVALSHVSCLMVLAGNKIIMFGLFVHFNNYLWKKALFARRTQYGRAA